MDMVKTNSSNSSRIHIQYKPENVSKTPIRDAHFLTIL